MQLPLYKIKLQFHYQRDNDLITVPELLLLHSLLQWRLAHDLYLQSGSLGVMGTPDAEGQSPQKVSLRVFLKFAGVNLLVGTENGLMLLDRSGQGKVYNLINRRRFQQMDVLEGLNVLVTISGM